MSSSGLKKTTFLTLLSIVAVMALLVVSTYAWFTNNSKVETSVASGKSGEDHTTLLIGSDEGNLVDSSKNDVEIAQVNTGADIKKMQPVSTTDLDAFMYCAAMSGGKALISRFVQDENEKRLFHGRVYLKMEGDNLSEEDKFKLYLDTSESSGGSIVGSDDSGLLGASRLGLKIGDNDPIIIQFESSGTKTENNTWIDENTQLGEGKVVDKSKTPQNDPAVLLSTYTLNSEDDPIQLPEKELATIAGNQVVQVDVYFYLEGCDKDCISDISTKEANLRLGFYAVAE